VKSAYGTSVLLFSCLFVALGIALVVQTARAGGGVGYLIGILFIALGVGRTYLQRRRSR
jgi:hypothetical protein